MAKTRSFCLPAEVPHVGPQQGWQAGSDRTTQAADTRTGPIVDAHVGEPLAYRVRGRTRIWL